jgi:hypothetical protein
MGTRAGVVCTLLTLAAGVSLVGQTQKEWAQPYRQLPGYWELVGRLFADSDVLRRDRGFRGFLDPSVLAVASLKPRTKAGEILATFVPFQLTQNSLNANTPPDRVVAGTLSQVLFAFADKNDLRLEVRSGYPSPEFQQCADARWQRFAHLLDVRLQAVMMCAGGVSWTPFRPSTITLDAAAKSTLPMDDLGTLLVTYNAKTRELSASVQAP